jgi:hypothetical protein
MPYIKCTFTLDPQDKQLLSEAAARESTNVSEIVRRSIVLRDQLIDAITRLPAEGRGRYARVAILPEGTPQPEGAEVLRLRISDPTTAKPKGAPATQHRPTAPPLPPSPPPRAGGVLAPASTPVPKTEPDDEPEFTHLRVDDPDADPDDLVDAQGNLRPVRAACGRQVDASAATATRAAADCPRCRA